MSGELTERELRTYFDQDVVPYLEEQRAQSAGGRSWPPALVYTGGQPGAGKSRANERAAQATGRWLRMGADYLREQRADVLIEATLRSPEAMAETIAAFREAGYVVELRVVAVPHEVSRLSTVERYTGQVAAVGAGRWTPSAAHDEAFEKAPATIRELIAAGAVDRFVIEDRAGETLFDRSYFGVRDEELPRAAEDAVQEFEHRRAVAQLTPEHAHQWLAQEREQASIVSALGERDPDLLTTMARIEGTDVAAVAQQVRSVTE